MSSSDGSKSPRKRARQTKPSAPPSDNTAGVLVAQAVSPAASIIFRRVPADVRPRAVERFARKLQDQVAKGLAFDCLITGDAELRRLNLRFRSKDQPTDVLSFPSAQGGPLDPSLGSLAISLQRARTQARAFGHSTEDEIRILMLHGVLHLTGLDHETDAGRMARAEKLWRTRLGLATSLIARVQA